MNVASTTLVKVDSDGLVYKAMNDCDDNESEQPWWKGNPFKKQHILTAFGILLLFVGGALSLFFLLYSQDDSLLTCFDIEINTTFIPCNCRVVEGSIVVSGEFEDDLVVADYLPKLRRVTGSFRVNDISNLSGLS